jgi:hypothetical protein
MNEYPIQYKHTNHYIVINYRPQPDSGLEIRDRMWLKITIPNAFIGEFNFSLHGNHKLA